MEVAMRTLESDLETLRMEQEKLRQRLIGVQQWEGSGMSAEEIPRVLPEETRPEVYEAAFEILGHDEQKPEAGPVAERSSVSTTPASFTEGTSIFVRAPSIEIRTGTIFKSRRESGGPAHLELAGIQGSSEGLVAPPSTPKAGPTTGFLPIVQAPAETFSISVASQRPTSEEGYSETLEVLPAMMVQPPPPSAMPVTSTRTYLVPWHVNADPEVLARMLNWVLQTLVLPDDSVKLLISGELPGIEAVEGYISHLITNDYYLKNKETLQRTFPFLVDVVESTGLAKIPFQIEIRRNESLTWSIRTELQWPHANDQVVVVVPTSVYEYEEEPGPARTHEELVLRSAPCTVVQFKV